MLGFYDPKVDIDIAIENELAAIRALRITENGETRQPSEGENIQACATERNLIRRHQYLNMLHLLRRQPLQLYLQYCFGGAEKNGAGVATVCTVLLQDSEGVAISH